MPNNMSTAALLMATCMGAGCASSPPTIYKPVEVIVEKLVRCDIRIPPLSLMGSDRAQSGTEVLRVMRENIKRRDAYIARADKALAECRGETVAD
jgi:starvation-inducible outer membrane lipoprotein